MEDRVCMHYIIERLDGLLEPRAAGVDTLINGIAELRRELLFNLGVNEHRRWKGDTD
jgi:hypothetical protein